MLELVLKMAAHLADSLLLSPEHQDVLRMVHSREIQVQGGAFATALKGREPILRGSIYAVPPESRSNRYGTRIHRRGHGPGEQERKTVLVTPSVEGITPVDDQATPAEPGVQNGGKKADNAVPQS